MKKILVGLMLSLAPYQVHAVLCVVQTHDPRYHVASYIRNQTSCNTTQYAGVQNLKGLTTTLLAIMLISKFIDYLKTEDQKSEFFNRITDKNSKVYKCESVDVIETSETSYVGMDGIFEEIPKVNNIFYQRKLDIGVIRFDPSINMMLVQRWGEKTARSGSCKYKGTLSDL